MDNLDGKNLKVGLALGGGGARGLAHVGVLKVLEREGIKIDYLAGVSMGAFIGACYAVGLSVKEMEEEAVTFNKRKAVKKMLDLANPKRSILKGKKAEKYINKFLEKKEFKDTKIPLCITATDLANGEEVFIKDGNLARAVRASVSVPGIFPPVKIGDKYLVDGGVVNCTPVSVLEKAGMDVIIAVDLIIKREVKFDKIPSMITSLVQSYEIIRSQTAKNNVSSNKNVILIKPELRGTVDSFKFYDIDKFIRSGERATEEALPEIRKKLGL
ncbi:patatin-like phospholipase family protein [bacterium]|nr:patatin-like phospholipase family protein [bacterium]